MMAPTTSRASAPWQFNQLQKGAVYEATTRFRVVIGEYLGMASPYGERAILLRNAAGTESITLNYVTSIQPAAA
jgi:hypothetical protein